MVAILTGNGLGLERSSGSALGARGQVGSASHGRTGERVTVNAANGNLLIGNRDEFLIGRGPDSAINRTYNSLGQFTDENGDNWANFYSRVVNHVGTIGQPGAYLDRLDWDGGTTRYSWDSSKSAYVSKEGGGAYDSIGFDGQWWWQDGETGIKEIYGSAYQNRVIARVDRDGNAITFAYESASGNLFSVATADGNYTNFTWSGNNLIMLTTTYTDTQTNTTKNLIRTRYAYDGLNRLTTVWTDLSPEDNSITDGRVYTTNYSYHGTSKLVASITQTDGSRLDFSYDGSNRVTSFTEWVDASTSRTTSFNYGAGYTNVTDHLGNTTALYSNSAGQLTYLRQPEATAGGNPKLTEFIYNADGDIIEVIEGYWSPDLLDKTGWAGEQRGSNLINLAGWPSNPDALPTGVATVTGWQNPSWTIDEARWAKTIGPDGTPTAVIQVGQNDNAPDGGGNYTNSFVVDKNKAYEFTTYFQLTETGKHTIYFGLDGSAPVVSAFSGAPDGNPYFMATFPNANSTFKAGRWYKVISYVLPSTAGNLTGYSDLGGIYDVGSGERVADVNVYRWADSQPVSSTAGIRFFNYYHEATQGFFTNYYKLEAREINLAGGAANVNGWANWLSAETRWGATLGPNGQSVFAMQTGQTSPDQPGGGTHSSQVAIDRNKAYEFTYYFKMSSLDKHYVYFGLWGDLPVENLANGALDTNPYFYYPAPGNQGNRFVQDRWYKVVGFVLPQGSTETPPDQLGGVFDTTTGTKVDSLYNNYRWAASGGADNIGVRYFNYYGDVNSGYSTWFYKPEIREATGRTTSSGGYAIPLGEQITQRRWYKYDTNGNLIEEVDQVGQTTRYIYGTKNEQLSATTYSTTDADGVYFTGQPTGAMTTRYVYDSEGHLRFKISAEGRVAEYRYNAPGQMVSAIDYAADSYSSSTNSLSELEGWAAVADKSQAEWIDYVYDFRGNLSTETNYRRLTAGGSLVEAGLQTTYVYDQFGNLLSKLANDGSSAETYAYDGMGRTIRHTDAEGVGTWTSFIDVQARTVTTLANGLTTTSVYNRAGELVASSEARGGVVQENSINPDVNSWVSNSVRSSVGTIDGAPATLYTTAAGQSYAYAYSYVWMEAGETQTWSVSIQGHGSVTSAALGIWANVSGWSGVNFSSARIISGPGTIVQDQSSGGYFTINGLSTTEPTRIEVTRTFTEPQYGYPHFYAYGGVGQGVLVGAQSITKSRYDPTSGGGSFAASDFNINNWGNGGVTVTGAGTIGGGATANQYIVNSTGQWSGVATGIYAKAGDSFTTAVTLKGAGGGTSASFGIYGNITNWDYSNNAISSARIISGPGTLTQEGGGLWNITGLSATQETRIEIVRTFQTEESGGVYLYPNRPEGWIAEQGIIAGAPSISRMAGSLTSFKYDSLGRLKIKIDPVGAKTYFLYDRAGRRTAEVDGDGSLTEYKYDAADRLIATVEYENAVSAGSIAALENPFANNEVAGIRPASSVSDRWSWNINDKSGRLIQTIDAAGASVSYMYDGAGRLIKSTRYANVIAAATLSSFMASPPTAFVQAPSDSSVDRTRFSYYDNDGLLVATVDEDMFVTEYVYDKAGRQIETVRYANAASASYQPTGAFTSALPGTWAQVKASITQSTASDIRNYTLYDGRGNVVATVDGEGNVTQFSYTARGQVAKEIRGRKLNIDSYSATTPAQRTIANLQGWLLGGNIEDVTDFAYDARGQLISRVGQLTGGTETTAWTYDSMGNKLTETTSETVSSESRTQSFRYDAKGRLIAELGGVGSSVLPGPGANQSQIDAIYATYGTRYAYDAADRLISKTTPDGSGTSGNKTVYYYDGDGQLRYEINALGEVTEYRYNVLEDRTDSIAYGTRIAAGTLGTLNGGLVTATVGNAVAAIANSAVDSRDQFAYNNRGELWVHTRPGGGLNDYQSYYYNAFGDVINQYAYPQGADQTDSISTSYFRRGLVYYERRFLNNSGAGAAQNTYYYDAFGRMTVEYTNNTDWRHRTNGYDRANRLVRRWDQLDNHANFSYDSRSNLISRIDRTSRSTSFAHDQNSRTITTTTAEGIVSTVKKNAYGQMIKITDGAGRTTSYTYDKNGNLKTVTDAAGTTTKNYDNADRLIEVIDGRGVKTQYSYDAAGRVLTEIRDASGLNITTAYAYDAKGQQIQITHALGTAQQRIDLMAYDLKGQKIQVVQDAGGLAITTSYQYRADGKVTRMTEAVGTAAERRTDYEYDSMGRLTREIVDPLGLNLSTRYYYDVNDNVVATTDARGFTTRFVYDRENRQIFSVSAGGEVVESGYDAEGRLIWTRGYANRIATATVDGFANEVAESTVRANLSASTRDSISRTAYDADGRKVYELDAEDFLTGFVYDGASNLVKTIRYAEKASGPLVLNAGDLLNAGFSRTTPQSTASVTTFAYDSANRLISATDAEGYSESYQYDAAGNRTQVTNKLGGVTTYTFDALGRVATEVEHGANVYSPDGGLLGSTITRYFFFDAAGNLIHKADAGGYTHQRNEYYAYDKLGRLTSKTLDAVQVYDPPSGGDTSATPIETYQYDQRGNLILVTDPAGAKTYSYYDRDNRKVAEISPVGQYKSWTYDGQGNVLTERTWGTLVGLPASAGGTPPATLGDEYRETSFVYDRNGRQIERRIAGVRTGSWNGSAYISNADQTIIFAIIYDAFGNLVQETDANGNVTYHFYDRNGRATAKVDPLNFLTLWTRDEDGNVTSERRYASPIGTGVHYTSDIPSMVAWTPASSADRVTNFTYDKNGRRLTETRVGVGSFTISSNGALDGSGNDSTIQYAYNGLGLVTSKTEANGDRTDYAYDVQGRLYWRRDPAISDFSGTIAYRNLVFSYDGLGNLVRTVEQAENATGNYASGYSGLDSRITRYQYGPGGRLRSMWDANGVQTTYQYDIIGRVRRQQVITIRSSGEYLSSNHAYGYDLAGRVTEQLDSDYYGNTGWQWNIPYQYTTYNVYGEVATKSIGDVEQERFDYDAAGRLVKTNSGDGVWKFFVHDGNGNVTLTLSAAGGVDTASYTQRDAVASIFSSYSATSMALASFYQGSLNATVVAYDKRGQAITSYEPGRQVAGTTQTLTRSQTYNAFGEVASETDARGFTTDYSYNNMGRVTQKQSPYVNVTSENGATSSIRPTETYHYDISGRLIATRDANNYLTTRLLLAGTGHEGSDALVTKEFRADASVWETRYDAYRDARITLDGLGRSTAQSFDKMGRVTQITRPAGSAGQLVEYYSYDGLGRRLKAWNNLYGAGDAATTDYDALGRVTVSRATGGDVTSTVYSWQPGIVTTGLSPSTGSGYGGWRATTSYANGLTSETDTDSFGHEVRKRDMSGWRTTTVSYDQAGRVVSRNTAGTVQSYAYFNTGQVASVSGPQGYESFSYDANGNRLTEYMTAAYGAVVKNASASYDALNRMTQWTEAGSATTPAASTTTSYDAVGNIRRTQASFYALDAGGAASYQTIRDYWFRYDSMNRLVTDRGKLSGAAGAAGTTIVRGAANAYNGDAGQDMVYDAAGQRKYVLKSYEGTLIDTYYTGMSTFPTQEISYLNTQREDFEYDGAGALTKIYSTGKVELVDTNPYAPFYLPTYVTSPAQGVQRSTFVYDLMGRQTGQTDYDVDGYTAVYNRIAYFNSNGQLTSDASWTKKEDYKTYSASNSYYFTDYTSGQYMLGNVGWMQSTTSVSGTSGSTTSRTVNSYQWWDSAVQSSISHKPNISQSTTYTTSFYLNNLGQLTGAYIGDGKPRNVSYTLDNFGQIIRRDESGYIAGQTGNPHELWYRFGGRQLGYTGNNGTSDISNDMSIAERRTVSPTNPGTYRNGQMYGIAYADFAQSHDPINSYYQGAAGGSYRVNQGDTLAGIAQSLYGDSSLWYKIAEANGLSAATALIEGQTLVLPTGVIRSKNNASTFKPYDAAEATGDLNPATPKPPKKAKCGAFGQLILIAIAVAISVIAPFGAGFVATIGNAVLGSVISQGFGIATGLQEKFSFKQVALAGLSAGVSAGLSSLSTVGNSAIAAGTKTAETLSAGAKTLRGIGQFLNKGTFLSDVVRGAASSAISQGVATATGLQDRFSWTGVAVGGLVSGVVGAANRGLAKGGIGVAASAITSATERNAGFYANQMLSGMAGAIAGGAARSLANGSSFGDNILATLPDVIGATIGNLVGDAARGRFDSKPLTPDPANGSLSTKAPAGTPQRYWGIAKPLSNVQYWGGQGEVRFIDQPDGDSMGPVMTDLIGSTRTGDGDGLITVTGQRPNEGRSFFQTITNAASAIYRPIEHYVVNPIRQNVIDPIKSRLPSLQTIDRYDPIYRGLKAIGRDDWAQAYQGSFKDGPRNAVKHGIEFLDAAGGWVKDSAYSLITDPRGTTNRGFSWVANEGPKLPGRLVGAVVGGSRATYADITSGEPARIRQGTAKLSEVVVSLAGPAAFSRARNVVSVGGGVVVESNLARGLSGTSVVSPARAEAFLVKNGFDAADAKSFIGSFDGPITARIVRPGEDFLRYTGNPNSTGSFLTKTRFGSPGSAVDGLYLGPYGNPATYVQTVTSSGRSIVLEGAIKNGGAGVGQTVIHNRGEFTFGPGVGF